jgi:type I restriction enzyme, S subunit
VSFQTSRWPMVAIGDAIASVKPGFASGERCDDGVIQFRMNNVDRAGNISWDAVTKVPADSKKIASYGVKLGDVLFNQTNSRDLVGKTAFFPGHPAPVVFSNHFLRLRPRSERLDGAYLSRYLQALYLTGYFGKKCNAWVNQATFGKDDLLALQMPLPPLDEQRRIAAILDKADSIRRKRRQALALADDFLRSAFLEMFGDPRRNPLGLQTESLGQVAAIQRGRFSPRPRNDPAYYGGDYPFIQTGDISKAYGYLSRWTQTLNGKGTKVSKGFPEGTVVIAIVGATIGETAILSQETYFPDSVIGISPRPTLLTPEFVEYGLRFWKQAFRDLAPETARANINIETLRPIQLMLPQLEDQERFSKLYRCVHRKLSGTRSSDDGTLFASLSQRAFRGEL